MPFRAGVFKTPPYTVPAPGPALVGMLPPVRCRRCPDVPAASCSAWSPRSWSSPASPGRDRRSHCRRPPHRSAGTPGSRSPRRGDGSCRRGRAPRRVSPFDGRVDYPRLAVQGHEIFAVWTNANNGAIRFATTNDLGATWSKRTVGTTSSTSDGSRAGFAGLPDVGVSGTNVALVWFADQKGQQQVALSSTGGTDLKSSTPSTTLVGSSPNDGQRYAAAAGSASPGDPRVAVAFTTQSKVLVRVWDGVTLGPELAVASFPTTAVGVLYAAGYGPAVLPTGSDGLSVAFAACRRRF